MKKLKDYTSIFIEKGYTPLEHINSTKQKIKCQDEDGYLYYASYDMLRDKSKILSPSYSCILLEIYGFIPSISPIACVNLFL